MTSNTASANRHQHLTKTEMALHELRERIREGELRPGERLRVLDLARQMNMSPTPIREALRLLQADRLVTFRPHYGAVVAEISREEVIEIFRLRATLEPMAVEIAVPLLTSPQLEELKGLHNELIAASHDALPHEISGYNAQWHWMIYKASGSAYLLDFIQRLWAGYPWRLVWATRTERSLTEHAEILDAILEADAAAAAERMKRHIQVSEAVLMAHIDGLGSTGDGSETVARMTDTNRADLLLTKAHASKPDTQLDPM